MIKCLRYTLCLQRNKKCSPKIKLIWVAFQLSNIILNAEHIKPRIRRTPIGYANEEREHLEKLLEALVKESSASEWASPGVLVRERDGSVKWCIDLPKLNDVTVKDNFPLQLLQDCIDAIEGCQYLTTLYFASGYYQLEVAEEDRYKTAFVTKYVFFHRMPFGLCNPPLLSVVLFHWC